MKFLTKINRPFLISLTTILFMVSIAGYFVLQIVILDETKESLLEKEYFIIKQIEESGKPINIPPIIEVKEIDSLSLKSPAFTKIYVNDELEDEQVLFLEYSNQLKIKDSCYSIKLRQASYESEDLILMLSLGLFVLLFAAFGISFFITKKINKTIWAEFENNLREIENFSFTGNQKLQLIKSDIEEFDRLNAVVKNLTEKLETDYISLREFTENASHEIQTPISIVLLNLEELLQHDLTEEAFRKIVSSINAIKRLSNLNQSLIMLTKIENEQFNADKTLAINEIVKSKILEYESLFESKSIKVEFVCDQIFKIKMNEQLADVMIGNLLSNAVNHNFKGGNIQISIREKELMICNTGEANSFNTANIFNRFVKGNSRSFGLGLALVKKICDTHKLEIEYRKNDLHCFIIQQKS